MWVAYIVHMKAMRNAYKILVGSTILKRALEK
jgi:hypothetical protein